MPGPHRPVVVGSLPGGDWVGFAAHEDGFRLVIGDGATQGVDAPPTDDGRRALLALAIAYFEEALDEPPADAAEATQQDIAELIAWLGSTAADPAERTAAREALDAVEDGLPGDAVALRLIGLWDRVQQWAPTPGAPIDPLGMLAARVSAQRGR